MERLEPIGKTDDGPASEESTTVVVLKTDETIVTPPAAPEIEKKNCCQQLSEDMYNGISSKFSQLGGYIGNNPWRFVIMFLLLPLICIGGVTMINSEGRPEELWVPTTSDAAADKKIVDASFPSTSRTETVILVPSDGDIFSVANFNLMLSAYNLLAGATAEYEGSTLTWANVCLLSGSDCTAYNALEPFNYTVPTSRTDILSVINSNPSGSGRLLQMLSGVTADATMVFGGITTDSNNDITAAKAAKLVFKVKNDRVRSSKGGWESLKAEAWELEWLEIAEDLTLSGMTVARFATRTRRDEFSAAIKGDVVLVNIALILLLVYCCLTIGRLRKGETRVAITLFGLVSIGVAGVSGVGFTCGFCGVNYTPLHGVLPFLLLGLGVDDMFVITNAFDLTNKADSIPRRMAESLGHSASAILLTSLTDTLAFCIGIFTSLPALSDFCITAGVCIAFIFIYQVFLFVPLLVIDERRREQGYNDLFCCCRSCGCDCCVCAGNGAQGETTAVESTSADGHTVLPNDPNEDDVKNCVGMPVGFIRRVLRRISEPWIGSTIGNVVGVSLFVLLLGIGIAGAVYIEADADTDRFFPGDSYAHDYFGAGDEYFTSVGLPAYAYTRNPSYWQLSTEMSALYASIKADPYIVSTTVSSWNLELQTYMAANGLSATSEALWYTHLNAFLASSAGTRFRRHIVFVDNDSDGSSTNYIQIARIQSHHIYLAKSNDQVKGMDSFRSTIEAYDTSLGSSLGTPFGFGSAYSSYEGYKVVETECYRNVGSALGCIMITVIALIPSFVCSSLVFVVITSTIVEVCGFMHWWGLYLDNVTVVMLIVAVGLAVDYAAHIAHAFTTYAGNPTERAQRAMYEIGTCVWHGFVSTFLAIVVLAPSNSYVFAAFFKQLFLASTLGVVNGLFLLPILLKLTSCDKYHAGFEQSHSVLYEEDITNKNELPPTNDELQTVGLSSHLQMGEDASTKDVKKDD